MNLAQKLPTEQRQIVVGDKLIEVGDDVWQIKNLTGISRREVRVAFDAPEPTFDEAEPKGSINWFAPILGAAIGYGFAVYFNHPIPAFVGLGLGLLKIWNSNTEEKLAWSKRKAGFEQRHAIWKELKENPPIVYSLTIETNSGSRPAFYSFDKDGIAQVVNAVREAMVSSEHSSSTYNINAIDLSGDTTVNNIGATIYEQNISEIKI